MVVIARRISSVRDPLAIICVVSFDVSKLYERTSVFHLRGRRARSCHNKKIKPSCGKRAHELFECNIVNVNKKKY